MGNKLYEKYPKIFGEKDLPASQTCMCWGISVGDGWYWLIDNIIIYNAVQTLTSITKSTNFDEAIFKSMDKVCQMLYQKHKETI